MMNDDVLKPCPEHKRTVDNVNSQIVDGEINPACPLPEEMTKIGDRIRARYEELGISQAEVARRCGMSAQRFGNYVNKRPPDVGSLVKIARALDTTPDALLGVNEAEAGDLTDTLGRLLQLEGISADRAGMLAKIALGARRLADTLPAENGAKLTPALAAQLLWIAQLGPKPDK